MFMDNNDIKENEIDNSDNISIHSIVTDQEEFDSDNEAPSDQTNQIDKIILNHVVKKIQIPGSGVEKPSKYDFITIKYQCYFLDQSDEKIIAVFAPALEGQFGKHNVASLKNAIKKLGFDEVYEVALGADATAFYEAKELKENKQNNKKMTTSCCPAFVAMIRKNYPSLLPLVSTTASPMTAISRYIKAKDRNAKVVFIGPCVAKKQEVKDIENTADYVLTFEELVAMFSAKGIKIEQTDEVNQDGSLYGKNFSLAGGVSESIKEAFSEEFGENDISCRASSGADECKKTLLLLKAGRLPEDIIEGMICQKGCISGPGTIAPYNVAVKNRNESFKTLNNINIGENLKDHGFKNIDMHVNHIKN